MHEQPGMHKQSLGTQALGSNRPISAHNGSPASSSGPTPPPSKSSRNEKSKSSDDLPMWLGFNYFFVGVIGFFVTGWMLHHYGFLWSLIPTFIAAVGLCLPEMHSSTFRSHLPARITAGFCIFQAPVLVLYLFFLAWSGLTSANEKQFYGEWEAFSKNYHTSDWKTRTKTTIEIMPKWADGVTDKKRRMVRTTLTEIKLDKPPYISEIKLKNYFDWHVEGDKIVFVSNDVYRTENGTPYMAKSEGEGSARITHNFDKDGIIHYTKSNGAKEDFRRGANPYGNKKSKAGFLW